VFRKERYNDIPSVTVWRVLRKRLHLKAYKVFKGVKEISSKNVNQFIVIIGLKECKLS
jgi:hypothetical protein